MKVYQMHFVSGDYIGEYMCDESPLEPGVYLIPAHCTKVAPPEFDKETQVCKWSGTIEEGSWNILTIEEAIEKSEPLNFQPTKEELDERKRIEEEAVNRKKEVLKKLGLSEEDMDALLF